MNDFYVALIGVVGTILGALVTVLGPPLLDKFRSPNGLLSGVVGLWKCEWYVDDVPGKERVHVKDMVKITKVSGWKIEGHGIQECGEYRIRGRYAISNTISLLYEGVHETHTLTGVLAMQVSPLGDRMEGKWYGYTRHGKLQGGRVVWRQAKNEEA